MDTALLWLLMNLSIAADWGQTRYISSHPDQFHERNLLMGMHPSVGKVDAYFVGYLLAHNGVMIALPKKYRPYYAGAVTAYEAHLVIQNNSIGIKVDF